MATSASNDLLVKASLLNRYLYPLNYASSSILTNLIILQQNMSATEQMPPLHSDAPSVQLGYATGDTATAKHFGNLEFYRNYAHHI
jgi:hypothetical protein